jgi:hypothetical protein
VAGAANGAVNHTANSTANATAQAPLNCSITVPVPFLAVPSNAVLPDGEGKASNQMGKEEAGTAVVIRAVIQAPASLAALRGWQVCVLKSLGMTFCRCVDIS